MDYRKNTFQPTYAYNIDDSVKASRIKRHMTNQVKRAKDLFAGETTTMSLR